MLNRYPTWKNLLVVIAITLGIIIALPNIYGDDPAVQVGLKNSIPIDASARLQVEEALRTADISFIGSEISETTVIFRFADTETQLRAVDLLKRALVGDYTVALNLAPRTPGWLRVLGLRPMNLGLDLRGGVHFLMEVDMNTAVNQRIERYESSFRGQLQQESIYYQAIVRSGNTLTVTFRSGEDLDRGEDVLNRDFPELDINTNTGDLTLTGSISETRVRDIMNFALQQNITTIRNRVNELGVAEPIVQQQGVNRIVVQLPGVQDTAQAKEILSATATLEFRLVDETNDPLEAERTGRVPFGSKLYQRRDSNFPVLLKRDVIVTGDQLTDAAAGFDENGQSAVIVSLDSAGARRMGETTKENLNRGMAVIFIENQTEIIRTEGEEIRVPRKVEEVISIATIRGVFSARFQITGVSAAEARTLSLLLRAGALAAPITIIEERTIGPSLGRDNIEKGVEAIVIGFLLVIVFMAVYYRAFGLVANLALFFNLVFIIALLSLLQATLTLPGIAGIVLTVGMAVDANVLIFERIREELRNGNTPQASIHAGYEKAFSTITDANITTLIAAIVLFVFGTGPIKGFAVTLSLGIITSMFTSIIGTRAVVNMVFGGRKLNRLAI
ncbi:MAG: protein translocase subunit SecD [Gammaproteobacteria bacterium]